MSQSDRIGHHIRKVADDPAAGEVLWRMRSDDGRVDFTYGDPDRPFFIASATKLYVTTMLAQLLDEGRLDWDAAIAGYLPDLDLTGLLVVGGRDLSGEITVRAVMSHTAGLADYFEDALPDGSNTLGSGPGQTATIGVKVTPKKTKKKATVRKTGKRVSIRTTKAPKGKVRVTITATDPGVTAAKWSRTWKVL